MTATFRMLVGRGRQLLDGRQDFIRSGFWSLFIRVAGMASGFALGVLLARMLGPKEFGIFGLVTTVAAVGMTVAQLGTPQLAVRELSVRAAREDWAGAKAIIYEFGITTTVAGIVIAVLALAGATIAGVSPAERLLVLLGAILTLLTAYTGLLAAELRGLGKLLQGQAMDIAVRPALTFVIVAGLLFAGRYMDAGVALTIQNLVALAAVAISAIWVWRAIPGSGRAQPRSRSIPWVRAALPLGAVDVLRQFDGSYAVILVGWLASGVELGVFRVAVACAVIVSMPVTIFHILLAPALSRLHASGARDELQRLLTWTSGAMVAVLTPMVLASWFLGRLAIGLVFGAVYADGWFPLFLLSVAQLIYGFFGMGPILLAMCGGERTLTSIYVIAVSAGCLTAAALTVAFGAAAAAAGAIVTAAIIGVGSRQYGRKHLGVEISMLSWLRAMPPSPAGQS